MVHSPFSPNIYSPCPAVHHLDNMLKSPCNGSESSLSKKRKQEYQYPITPVNDFYLPSQQQQKSQLLYSQQQPPQYNITYQHQFAPAAVLGATWNDYVRSNPSTPTSSPPPQQPPPRSDAASIQDYIVGENLPGNLSLSASDNVYGLDPLYNPYGAIAALPLNATSNFDNTTNYGYGDVADASIAAASSGNSPISNPEDVLRNHQPIESGVNSTENHVNTQKDSLSSYDPLAGLAAAAAMVSCGRDKSYTQSSTVPDPINGDTDVRHNHHRRPSHLMSLNITSQPNMYDLRFGESLSSSPSSVTMPPTPVFFEPTFLDGVTNPTMTDGYTFINPSISTDQLLERSTISRSPSFDSISTTSQHGSVFNSEKIIENSQTIIPTAITITQPYPPQQNFAPMLTQTPSNIDLSESADYFNSKQLRQKQQQQQQQRRRRSSSASNPPNIKAEPCTPALSPPESPNDSASSTSSSPTSPSPPHTPTYVRRMSISPTIMEEEEDMSSSSSVSNSNNLPLVASGFVSDMSSTVNPRHTQGATPNLMRTVIHQYLSSTNPSTMGEKTVIILTSKVAQKSYGTEKRFLCPPPTTLILGSSWWSPSPHNLNHSASSTTYSPPKISVGISGEQSHQQGILEWISPSGNPLDPNSCSEMAFSGKCVSKHLYINDADEKRKRVEVMVNIQSPVGHDFGTFASKPIKVISKPSKKRQSVKNMELCIHHGTTISLFNRIRSQTVSTKYLGVSMQNANQNFGPWNYGNGHMSSNPSEQPQPCFVARTGSWDPFIIWIVDPHYVKGKDDHSPQPGNQAFPRPPPSALKSTNGNPIPIHYNQQIVLQCLTTGMTSPTMVIRKVDKGSMVIGGGIVEELSGFGEAEEALGDPVSQLHKVAFQIKDTNVTTSPSTSPTFQPANRQHPPGPGTYLACLGDIVGMQQANEGRKIIVQPSSLPINTNFLGMKTNPSLSEIPAAVAAAWASATTDFPVNTSSLSESAVVSTEGGKVIRKRRVSSSVVVRPTSQLSKAALAKNRRRVNSLSGVASEVDLAKFAANSRNSVGHRNHDNAGALWTEDVTDAAVWTIVGTDCASYTFYSPQNVITSPSHHISSLLPSTPSTPVTPLPSISSIQSSASGSNSTTPNTITIGGENFTRDLIVWFGDTPSPKTEFRSKECLVCWLPEDLMYEMEHQNSIKRDIGLQGRHLQLLPNGRVGVTGRLILLSRSDGVVFKTGKVWP